MAWVSSNSQKSKQRLYGLFHSSNAQARSCCSSISSASCQRPTRRAPLVVIFFVRWVVQTLASLVIGKTTCSMFCSGCLCDQKIALFTWVCLQDACGCERWNFSCSCMHLFVFGFCTCNIFICACQVLMLLEHEVTWLVVLCGHFKKLF